MTKLQSDVYRATSETVREVLQTYERNLQRAIIPSLKNATDEELERVMEQSGLLNERMKNNSGDIFKPQS